MPATSEILPVLDRRPSEPRAVVTWEGPGEPIVLKVYGPAGEVAVLLSPTRALGLAKELLTRGVQAIKADQWGGE